MPQHAEYKNLFVFDHPLISHKLTQLRDETTDKAHFKACLHEITLLMGYEATHNLATTAKSIKTPLEPMQAPVIKGEFPVIVPILRAGLSMVEAMEMLMPQAAVGHIGVYRDEKTKQPVEYLVRLPDLKGRQVIVVDPMLATGHSASYAIDLIIKKGASPENIKLMCILSAPEGVQYLLEKHPKVTIYTAALDRALNAKAYIMPGLGDAGDRYTGTIAH